MGRVDGKTALVTGAAHGIGRTTARMLAEEGAAVALTDVDAEAGAEAAADIRAEGGEAAFYEHDVTAEDDWTRVVTAVHDAMGGPTVLVNNAGIYQIAPLGEMDVEDWRTLMDINVTGVFLGMKHCTPLMEAAGTGSGINVSSVAGTVWGGRPSGRGPWQRGGRHPSAAGRWGRRPPGRTPRGGAFRCFPRHAGRTEDTFY